MSDEKKAMRYTQAECQYVPLSEVGGKACANCRFFSGESGGMCIVCENYPNDILPTGYCNEWEALPTSVPASEQASEAAIEAVHEAIESALEEAGGGMDMDKATDNKKAPAPVVVPEVVGKPAKTLVERIKQAFTPKSNDSAFQVFKGSDGKAYWLARFTNVFEDRDNEILSQKAHDAYIARVNLGFVDKPELWSYHTKGTKHGKADQVWEHKGFVFALGHFDDTPEAQQAIKAYQKQRGQIELSHGFTFPKWALKDGVYETYNTFEISTLPSGAAANPFTTFEEIQTMALSDKQAAWIKSTLGDAALKRVQEAQKTAEADGEVLKAIDAKYKDFVETQPTESNEGGSAEVIKTLLADVIAANAAVVEELAAIKAEREAEKTATEEAKKAADATVADLVEQVKQLKVQLSQTPRAASSAPETQVNKNVLPQEVIDSMKERDPFWGVEITKETP